MRNLLLPPQVPEGISIVAVDERSLSEYGRWPWPRKLQAELLRKVLEGGPRVVAVDIFYSEPESPEADGALARVFSSHRERVVVALVFEIEEGKAFEGEIDDSLYDQVIPRIYNLSRLRDFRFNARRVLLPPEPIRGSATFGHVYSLPDRDGKLRWENLYIRYGDEYFPSLALQAARIALGVPLEKTAIIGGEGVEIGGRVVPTDGFGRLHINYPGPEGSFPYLSASAVLSGEIDPEVFRDGIVLIGTSAIATYDMKVTPFSANTPGVEKNAAVVANLLNNDYIVKAPAYVDILAVLLAGGLALIMGRRKRAVYLILLYVSLILVIVVLNQGLFMYGRIRLNLIYPVLTVLAEGAFIISHSYFTEERRAREIRRMFSSYVTERVVDELIRNPDMARLGGERRETTVLFSDIKAFTAFSERHPPEEVVALLNDYLGAMTEVIFRWDGTLDKFVGDEIVAFWGAPMPQENHAELAVRCALNMVQRLGELQARWRSEGRPVLDAGIGINTGEVVVGNIGAEGKKMDYTVIGDHVNLGARVEALTREYGVPILITEFTLERIRELISSGRIGHLTVRRLAEVVVKGRREPVRIYELRSLESASRSR